MGMDIVLMLVLLHGLYGAIMTAVMLGWCLGIDVFPLQHSIPHDGTMDTRNRQPLMENSGPYVRALGTCQVSWILASDAVRTS